jgi:adenine phosphoribosyltransferase
MEYTHVNIFVFLYYLIVEWSVDGAVSRLSTKYGVPKGSNFKVSLFTCDLWLLQTNSSVKEVLSPSADAKLTYISRNFIRSHGHVYGIGNLDFNCNLWHTVHSCLLKSISVKYMEGIMRDNSDILTHKYGFKYLVNDVVSEYIITIWSKFCFGEGTDARSYRRLRDKLIGTLHKTFYSRKTNYIPFLGCMLSKLYRYTYRKDFREIDDMIRELISKGSGGFIHEFSSNISSSAALPEGEISAIVLDNAFLSVLAYDFLYGFLLEHIIKIADCKLITVDDRRAVRGTSLEQAFLFPYRMRYINGNTKHFKRGNFAIVNLIRSNLPFSYGPRSCVGAALTYKIVETLYDIIKDYEIGRLDCNPILRSKNKNIPLISSMHSIELTIPQSTLKGMIDCFPHRGIERFYRVESITENILLYKYVCHKMSGIILSKGKVDYLVMSEARGFLFSPISLLTGIPIIAVRKSGKIAGMTSSHSYSKSYGASESLELSVHSLISGKNVIIVDDGIASGATTKAIYELIKCNGGNVVSVVVCIKHTYVENTFNDVKVDYIFSL